MTKIKKESAPLDLLEQDNDLATLNYLEAILDYNDANLQVRNAEIRRDQAKSQVELLSAEFNEARCRYLAVKLGRQREDRDVKKVVYTAQMAYAK